MNTVANKPVNRTTSTLNKSAGHKPGPSKPDDKRAVAKPAESPIHDSDTIADFAKINAEIIDKILLTKHNFLIHGPGGTGKSFLVKDLVKVFDANGVHYQKTATTGIAAVNIGGCTLHRFSGIGLGEDDVDTLWGKVASRDSKIAELRKIKVLIVDEISMLGAKLFDKIDEIMKRARESDEPFGGIRLICVGDFYQLPPVDDVWVFKSARWKQLDIKIIELTKPRRFTDEIYSEILLRIRKGQHTKSDIEILESRLAHKHSKAEKNSKIFPTIIFPLKRDVAMINNQQLAKLKTDEHMFTAKDIVTAKNPRTRRYELESAEKYYSKLFDDAIVKDLHLKAGAQVMLTANLDVDNGLANGTRGVIKEIKGDIVSVIFANSPEPKNISWHTWDIEDARFIATRRQIPLILAYALTCHRVQGCTLDKAICDLGHNNFAEGQMYVALSRVRSLDGLYILNFAENRIKINREVEKYMKTADKTEY